MARRIVTGLFGATLLCSLCTRVAHAGEASKGKTIFDARCSFCHGMSGRGDGPAGAALKPPPTNFTSPAVWKSLTPAAMKQIVENGKPGTSMVSFKGSLSADQIDDVIAYLETFKPKQ